MTVSRDSCSAGIEHPVIPSRPNSCGQRDEFHYTSSRVGRSRNVRKAGIVAEAVSRDKKIAKNMCSSMDARQLTPPLSPPSLDREGGERSLQHAVRSRCRDLAQAVSRDGGVAGIAHPVIPSRPKQERSESGDRRRGRIEGQKDSEKHV